MVFACSSSTAGYDAQHPCVLPFVGRQTKLAWATLAGRAGPEKTYWLAAWYVIDGLTRSSFRTMSCLWGVLAYYVGTILKAGFEVSINILFFLIDGITILELHINIVITMNKIGISQHDKQLPVLSPVEDGLRQGSNDSVLLLLKELGTNLIALKGRAGPVNSGGPASLFGGPTSFNALVPYPLPADLSYNAVYFSSSSCPCTGSPEYGISVCYRHA